MKDECIELNRGLETGYDVDLGNNDSFEVFSEASLASQVIYFWIG